MEGINLLVSDEIIQNPFKNTFTLHGAPKARDSIAYPRKLSRSYIKAQLKMPTGSSNEKPWHEISIQCVEAMNVDGQLMVTWDICEANWLWGRITRSSE